MECSQLNDSSSIMNNQKAKCGNQPVLHRALSTIVANQVLVENQRNILAENYRRTSVNDEIVTIDHDDADASFILPNLFQLPIEIRPRILNDLLDLPTMKVLEETKRLNWWVKEKLSCATLYPLMTTGDGNCLLHATSLALWGFHDHALSMRKALNETLITLKTNSAIYRRWRWIESIHNKKSKLVYSEEEWNEEWKCSIQLSSPKPRLLQTKNTQSNNSKSDDSTSELIRQCYESLEEIHVYVLANNIRRPIIIYSETILRSYQGEALSPIEFGGIYLPLEIPPEKCYKQPVFLTFDAAHFSALVPMESSGTSHGKSTFGIRIPIIDLETLDLLPIHFLVDPGLNFQWPINEELSDDQILSYPNIKQTRMEILGQYLDLSKEYSPLPHDLSTKYENRRSTIGYSTSPNNVASIERKSSRSSLNTLSKTLRRKLLHPFSSNKRFSLKHHQTSLIKENNVQQQRLDSPLLNPSNNILTIILVNFQPKRPEISDRIIQNYIDTYINEYRTKQVKLNLAKEEQSENHEQSAVDMPRMPQKSNQLISKNDFASSTDEIAHKPLPDPEVMSSAPRNEQFYVSQVEFLV